MHVLIIGNGIAGVTAARTIRQISDHRVTVISDEVPFFFSRPAMMYVSTGQLSVEHIKPYGGTEWDALDISVLHDSVVSIDAQAKICSLASGRTVAADALILATGSKPVLPGIDGLEAKTILTYTRFEDIARLDRAIEGSGVTAVVGGGLIGTEVAEILHARRKPFTWFVREAGVYSSHVPQEESAMITSHIRSFGVNLKTDADVMSAGHLAKYDRVIMCTGVTPRTELTGTSQIACNTGICVNERFETNVSGVYAIGDCAETPWGIDQRWHSGKEHGGHVARIVCGDSQPYRPSVFCNSAKFFDLEWQVFGNVSASGAGTIFKADPVTQRCVRFAVDERGALTGLHTIGVRLRQHVCEEWIQRAVSVEEAMTNFATASFDPEFTTRFDV